jgi:oxaloacetate decarboxylase alpha subunit
MSSKKIGITDVVLRDAHQSLLATRLRYEDMEQVLYNMDQVGYWSVESWGGAIFDSCIRYLGEDPWERIKKIKSNMPNTPQQMLLRGQNLLGYKHYADDVVYKFVEKAKLNGVDVFRVFDALNDPRNMETALKAVIEFDGHAQGTISYTTSPVHNLQTWVDLSHQLQDFGCHSIAIKDMAGLLDPYVGFELVSRLKEEIDIPLHLHSHATTGMSTTTAIKCIEAGLDNVDTSISSMSMTYGHSATETLVGILKGTQFDTDIELDNLVPIATHFRKIRKKYAEYEGSLRGVDARIISSQVPGGMLTNLENQLKEQNAIDRFDEVIDEIPKVRSDLGYIPLVTPTSQIVGNSSCHKYS